MRVKVVGCAVQHGERAEKFDHSVEFSAVVRRCTRPSGRVRIETISSMIASANLTCCTRPSGRVRIETPDSIAITHQFDVAPVLRDG